MKKKKQQQKTKAFPSTTCPSIYGLLLPYVVYPLLNCILKLRYHFKVLLHPKASMFYDLINNIKRCVYVCISMCFMSTTIKYALRTKRIQHQTTINNTTSEEDKTHEFSTFFVVVVFIVFIVFNGNIRTYRFSAIFFCQYMRVSFALVFCWCCYLFHLM